MYLPYAGDYTYIPTVNTIVAKRTLQTWWNQMSQLWKRARTAGSPRRWSQV
ncbi:MAG: hypothetical protein MUF62_07115 [Chitinophagaceae bacterium]|nr:hypothetical protein [Chitinophagaceae bacterium]